MKPEILNILENSIEYPNDRPYAAIIGSDVSKGARSPLLWNAAFSANEFDTQMLAFDVSEENLPTLVENLESDSMYIGGAVAVPYKESIAQLLGNNISPESSVIGAINCLFRGSDGRLIGTNTDGEGAIRSLESVVGELNGKSISIIGVGGTGKAVAAYAKTAIGATGKLMLANRTPDKLAEISERLEAILLPWPVPQDGLHESDIVINCSSAGAGEQAASTPFEKPGSIDYAETRELLNALGPETLVFDVIYDPSPTCLLKIAEEVGLKTLDGSKMNLEQAVLAFAHATHGKVNSGMIRSVMKEARS